MCFKNISNAALLFREIFNHSILQESSSVSLWVAKNVQQHRKVLKTIWSMTDWFYQLCYAHLFGNKELVNNLYQL